MTSTQGTPTSPDSSSSLYASPSQNEYSSTAAAATAAAALSQQHLPTSATSAANARKRKSNGIPGSRGVANLTPEQLAKKRANDRDAQRAIRERTKNTIEGLQRRIRELEGQQPYQDLQRVAQERDRALAECEQLRNKLAVVQSVVGGPQLAPQPQPQPNLHELAALTAQQSPLPPLNTSPTPHYTAHAAAPSYEQQHLHPELRSPRSGTFAASMNQSITSAPNYTLEQVPTSTYVGGSGVSYEARLPPPAAMLDQSNGERHGLSYVLEPKQASTSTSPTPQAEPHYPPPSGHEKPLYARLPASSTPTGPLDALLIDFIAGRHKQLAEGYPLQDVVGPDYPTFDGLRDPSAPAHANAHPISALLTEILFKFPGVSGLPEKVAVHYTMFLLIRWMICPCKSCYERMPDWMRPSKEQLEIPHETWINHLVWPFMRFAMITRPGVRFEDFFIPFTSTLAVNWPYPADQALIPAERPNDASKVQMNPVFESHIRNLRNWSVGTIFKTAFPQLVDQSVRVEG